MTHEQIINHRLLILTILISNVLICSYSIFLLVSHENKKSSLYIPWLYRQQYILNKNLPTNTTYINIYKMIIIISTKFCKLIGGGICDPYTDACDDTTIVAASFADQCDYGCCCGTQTDEHHWLRAIEYTVECISDWWRLRRCQHTTNTANDASSIG